MITRVLTIKLAAPLRAQLREHPKSELAKKIGVSPQKLSAMIDDEWEYITRDAIERAADYLKLTATDLFEFVPAEFWKPIEQAKRCTFLRGSVGVKRTEHEFHVPRYDDEATSAIKNFLRDSLPDIDEGVIADHLEDEVELVKRAERENCIVIGSPKSNAASEILISRFFGAKPFDSSTDNRRKIPFGFCWPDNDPITSRSSLACSALARRESKGRPGIALQGAHITVDYRTPANFHSWQTKKGTDCGIVFVANKPFGTKKSVKLIVLAGFSGIGTLAAAKALIQDFRYLEQLGGEPYVFGIVEGRYTKIANTNVRKLRDFSWKISEGRTLARQGRDKQPDRLTPAW
jgi:DNA-binding Xre family transcriptional regulator